ncbi:MAG TPA: hypothetical protein VGB03_08805, partial [Acidimicrobiales bacterium]
EVAERLKGVHPDCEVVLFSAYDVADDADLSPFVDHFLAKTNVSALGPLLERVAAGRGLNA